MPPRKPRRSIWDSARETPYQVAVDADVHPPPPDEPEADGPRPLFANLDGIHAQALQFAEGPYGYLLWMDSRFTEQGQPALSPWWRASLKEFFASEKIWGLYLVGRGGGKSTSLERVALLYVIFGCLFAPRSVPPGQRWIWPFISASTTDAGRRIREIEALLRALGIEAKAKAPHGAPTIELCDVAGNEVSFLSIAATIAGVSGPSALGGTVDEEAKLRDRAANVNPSTEILASIAQMFRARQGVHAIRCSSAWREAGSHYAAIKEGTTSTTYVARIGEAFLGDTLDGLEVVAKWEDAHGNPEAARKIREHLVTLDANSPNVPTWVANPTIGALASRIQVESTPVEKSEGNTPRWKIWLRENASVPLAASGAEGLSADEYTALGEMNRMLARKARSGVFRPDDLIAVPGYGDDFKPIAGFGFGRGHRGL